MSKKVYEAVASEVIQALESGNYGVWQKSWNYVEQRNRLFNPLSNNPFTGSNVFFLSFSAMARGFTSPYYATAKQIIKAGGKINKGSKGIICVRVNVIKESVKEHSERFNISVSSVSKDDLQTKFIRPSYYHVFNILEQTTGIEVQEQETVEKIKFNPIDKCESIINQFTDKPLISTGYDGRAFYTSQLDKVSVPEKELFNSPEAYYATLFHELAHSTVSLKDIQDKQK